MHELSDEACERTATLCGIIYVEFYDFWKAPCSLAREAENRRGAVPEPDMLCRNQHCWKGRLGQAHD